MKALVYHGPEASRALLAGKDLGEEKTDALVSVVREAAANSGHVSDATWARAVGLGWGDEQLTEAFAYLGLAVFTAYFLNYAATELDLIPMTTYVAALAEGLSSTMFCGPGSGGGHHVGGLTRGREGLDRLDDPEVRSSPGLCVICPSSRCTTSSRRVPRRDQQILGQSVPGSFDLTDVGQVGEGRRHRWSGR